MRLFYNPTQLLFLRMFQKERWGKRHILNAVRAYYEHRTDRKLMRMMVAAVKNRASLKTRRGAMLYLGPAAYRVFPLDDLTRLHETCPKTELRYYERIPKSLCVNDQALINFYLELVGIPACPFPGLVKRGMWPEGWREEAFWSPLYENGLPWHLALKRRHEGRPVQIAKVPYVYQPDRKGVFPRNMFDPKRYHDRSELYRKTQEMKQAKAQALASKSGCELSAKNAIPPTNLQDPPPQILQSGQKT
jgi:hypothetical protein